MVHWKNTIVIPGFNSAGPEDAAKLARMTAEALGSVRARDSDFELLDLIDDFKDVGRDEHANADGFDDCLSRLYDWGDIGHRLWIETVKD